jgi:hypothetical protein
MKQTKNKSSQIRDSAELRNKIKQAAAAMNLTMQVMADVVIQRGLKTK